MTEKEDGLKSEFQDFGRDFQRIDELRVVCAQLLLSITAPGGHAYLYTFVHAVDNFFMQFRFVCKTSEIKDMEDQYVSLLTDIDKEINQLNYLSLNAPNISRTVPRKLITKLRAYLLQAHNLRQKHNLSHRLRKSVKESDRIKQAFDF